MLKFAFKEWAVICKALAEGKQALILRKGGISESDGEFSVEHKKFWLYPTFLHQQKEGIKEDAQPLLSAVEDQKPPAGQIDLGYFADVTGIYHVKSELAIQMLDHLHIWSRETVAKRFAYKQPGLFVLAVRVYKSPDVHSIQELPEYQGCRSWVELGQGFPTKGAHPVIPEKDLDDLHHQLDLLLQPTAYA